MKDYRLEPLALIFQYQTGVRIGELVVLHYDDIETENYIHVQRMYSRDAHVSWIFLTAAPIRTGKAVALPF